MRRTLALLGLLATGVILLVNPVTGIVAPPAATPQTTVAVATTMPPTTTGAPPTTTGGAVGTTTTATTNTTAMTTAAVVIAGPKVWSEWGYFQVEITVEGGVMTAIELVDQPDDRKSERINDSAVPRYVAQALEIQGTDLDRISGATYTWRHFRESLAGAMEEAGLGLPLEA